MHLRRLPLLGMLLAASSVLAIAVAMAANDFEDIRGSLAADGQSLIDLPDDGAGKVVRQGPVDTADPTLDLSGVLPRPKHAEDDPFAPIGIRYGSFILFPALTLSAGYTTNATGAAGGRGAGFLDIEPEITIRSDWAEDELSLTAKGGYEAFTDHAATNEPNASIDAAARIDLPDRWTADFAGGYHLFHQSISDPNFPAGVDTPPAVDDFTGSADLNGRFGKTVFTVAGSAQRDLYDNGISHGTIVDQTDRNDTLYGVRARVGYELTPDITPFVEGEFTRRAYDRLVDDSGLMRSSDGAALRLGMIYDGSPVLKSEFAIGVHREDFDDSRLADLKALTVDGNFVWSPTALTTVTYAIATGFNPSTNPLSSGSVIYDNSLDLAYAYRRDFTIDLKAGLADERFQGTDEVDNTYRIGLGTVWKINRNLQLTSDYVHEWLTSTDASSNYHADTLTFALRLQR